MTLGAFPTPVSQCIAIGACLIVVGCGTPKPVLKLAEVSAANVSIVNTNLREFARTSGQVADRRARTMRHLDRAISDARMELQTKLFAMVRAKQSRRTTNFDLLKDLLGELDKIRNEGAKDGISRAEALDSLFAPSRSKLVTPEDLLGAASKSLIKLSKDDNFEGRARFFAKFVSGVIGDIKAQAALKKDAAAAAGGATAAKSDKITKDSKTDLNDK